MNYLRFFPILILLVSQSALSSLWPQETIQRESGLDRVTNIDRYRSRVSGTWNTPSTWETSNDGGRTWSTATSTTPASGSSLSTTILSGHTIIVTQSVAIDSTVINGRVTINSGQTLTITNGSATDLTVNGTLLNQGTFSVNSGATWVLNSGATFIHNATSGISAALNAATINSSSTFEYKDSGTPSLGGRTYGNLKLTTAGSKTYTNSATSGSLTIGGSLEIGVGVTWNTGAFEPGITVQGSTTIDGTWTGAGSGNQGTHTFNGSFAVSSSGTYSLATTGTTQGSLNFNGDLVNNGSLNTPTNRTVNFSSGSPQTIGGASTISFGNGFIASQHLAIAPGMTVQAGAGKVLRVTRNLTVSGAITGMGSLSYEGNLMTLANNGSITAPTTLVPSTMTVAGTGLWNSLTVASGCNAIVDGQHALTGAGTPLVVNGTAALNSGSTIIYSGSSSQTVAPLAYRNLEINNLAGTSLSSGASVSGVLTLRKGVFSVGANLTLGSSASITRETGSLSGAPMFGSQLNVSYIGTVAITSGAEIPSNPSTLIGLTISNSGGVTLGDPATVSGTLDVSGGNLITGSNTLTLGPSATITETAPFSVVGKLSTTRSLRAGVNETFGGMGVEIDASGAAPGLTNVSRVTGSASAIGTGTSMLRYFDITPAVDSGLAATLVFRYRDGDLNGTNETKLKLFKSTDGGSTWANVGGNVNASNNAITLGGVNSFSRWTAGEPIPAPTLGDVSPSSGELGASLSVTLTGTNFVSGVSTVAFSGTGISVNSVTVNSSTQIVANIAISSGATPDYRSVSVTNAGAGTATLPSAFEVRVHLNPLPSITSVTPSSAARGQSLNISVRGHGFVSRLTVASFGDSIGIGSLTGDRDTLLIVPVTIAPGAVLGVRDVSVVNPAPGGGTATLSGSFTVANPSPSLSSLSPTIGGRGQSLWVMLVGSNFVRDSSRVSFGAGMSVDSTVVANSSSLQVKATVAPDAATGPRDVTVTNTSPGGGIATLAAAFSVVNPEPTILTAVPDSGWLGQVVHVVLTGTNFVAGVTAVSFGNGIIVDSVTVLNSSLLQARLTIATTTTGGPRDVSVTNGAPGGGSATLSGGFRVLNPVPTITSVDPIYGVSGQSVTVTIVGMNFIAGLTTLNFGAGISVSSLTFIGQTQITATISIAPSALSGLRDVVVSNPGPGGGSASLIGAFAVNYPAPTLLSLSATSGCRGKTLNLLVNGLNFVSGVTALSLGSGIVVNSITVSSVTQLFATISIARNAVLGPRDATVTNSAPGGGTSTIPAGFAVQNPGPVLTEVAPNTGNLGQTLSIKLTGSDFLDGVSNVSFGPGITMNSFTIDTLGTQIVANITIGTGAVTGQRNVVITNSGPGGGTTSLAGAFGVMSPKPTLTGISPLGGVRGQTLDVLLTGSSFIPNATTVSFGTGVTVNSTTVPSSIQMAANISIGADASLGPRGVDVTNQPPGGGTASLANAFTIANPAPTLVSLNPTSGIKGQSLEVVVEGTNFLPGVTSVSFGEGVGIHSTAVNSLTQLKAGISIASEAAPGVRSVAVTNLAPGGGSAILVGGFIVANPAPTLISISPVAGYRGQSLTVTHAGADFISGVTSVDFGPDISIASLNVKSSGQLVANIAIGGGAAPGARSVTVTNAGPGGGTAAMANAFTVWNPAPTLTGLSPATGIRGQSLNAVMTGVNFFSGTTTLNFGAGVTVNTFVVTSLTEATANVTIPLTSATGTRDVSISNPPPGGGTATLSGAFTVTNPAPALASVAPSAAGRGSTLSVTVTGSQFISGVTSLSFGADIAITGFTVKSLTELEANIAVDPSAATGPRTVVVTNAGPGGGSSSLTNGFMVTSGPATTVEGDLGVVPDHYVLHEAYPNPFNSSTKIRYGLPEDSRIRLDVHNMLGNVVAELVLCERSKGSYELQWHAGNLPSGVYLIRIHAESLESTKKFIASRKVVLVK